MSDVGITTKGVQDYVGRHFTGFAIRAFVFTCLWWGLTEGATDSWIVGIPAVIGASLASYLLSSQRISRWNPKRIILFVGFFGIESLRAGVDVAWRALTLKIAPEIIEYESSLTDEKALTLFCGTVSLLPGTLMTEIRERTLMIHTLDSRQPVREQLRRLEFHINAMQSCCIHPDLDRRGG